ncbi:MAG: DUF3127 domain-containing protein [Bacteroidales bacterium]|nr:DUF3127 domain-containing protein [Bacteroidales bacterium]
MEITGRIIQFLPEVKGEGKNGPWKKQEFIIETQEQYPKKVCISSWNDKAGLSNFSENDMVTVGINIESREYNGRWFTDVRAWRMAKADQPGVPQGENPVYSEPDEALMNDNPTDDLPF